MDTEGASQMCGLECIPLSAYCAMTGETKDKIKNRVKVKEWRLGTQVLSVPGTREWWVDLAEVTRWARQYSIPLTDKESGFNIEALDKMDSRRTKKNSKN